MVTIEFIFQSFIQAIFIYMFIVLISSTENFFEKENEVQFDTLDDYKSWLDEQQSLLNDLKADYEKLLNDEEKDE